MKTKLLIGLILVGSVFLSGCPSFCLVNCGPHYHGCPDNR